MARGSVHAVSAVVTDVPPRRRLDWRTPVRWFGLLCLMGAAFFAGYVGWLLWGTGLQTQRAQDALRPAIESLLCAVVADGMIGGRHKSNLELCAQGVGTIASICFGGIPATGAIARTAANVKSGGRTPLASVELNDQEIQAADCVVIVTNHSQIDYARVTEKASLVVDTRNALNGDLRRESRARIIRL